MPLKKPKRTDPFAEGSVKQDAEHDNRNQNTEFKRKQLAQCRPDCGISDGKRDRPLQNALRTNIFAEERISHPDRIRCKHRQKNHKNNKDDIFQIPQRLQSGRREFLSGDFVKQILKPSKRTQKTTDESSQCHAE